MILCLRHVKMILRNQSFFTDFVSVCSKEEFYPVMDAPIHGVHYGASYNSV